MKLTLKTDHKVNTEKVLVYVLKQILKLLHPFMPFVTERLYQSILKEETIVTSSWPVLSSINDEAALREMALITEMITKVRQVRQEMAIAPTKPLTIEVVTNEAFFKTQQDMLSHFLRSNDLKIKFPKKLSLKEQTILITGSGYELYILKKRYSFLLKKNKKKRHKELKCQGK